MFLFLNKKNFVSDAFQNWFMDEEEEEDDDSDKLISKLYVMQHPPSSDNNAQNGTDSKFIQCCTDVKKNSFINFFF